MRVVFLSLLIGSLLTVQIKVEARLVPVSLQNVPLPPVPGLLDGDSPIVVNKTMAIALGKALFWDQNVGSDGQACASCHFSAGADGRIKNQINPGQNSVNPSGQTFDPLPAGGSGAPNHTLGLNDFPLRQFSNPNDKTSPVLYTTNDVVGSAGTFSGQYTGSSQFNGENDQCVRNADPVFNVNNIGVLLTAAKTRVKMAQLYGEE